MTISSITLSCSLYSYKVTLAPILLPVFDSFWFGQFLIIWKIMVTSQLHNCLNSKISEHYLSEAVMKEIGTKQRAEEIVENW